MAVKEKIKVVEINEGTKIQYTQSDTKLFFGDDEIMINCAKYQRDWLVHLDICADKNNNLVLGVGEGRYYVAQVDIPATKYVEETETVEDEKQTVLKPVDLDMSDVTLTLWSIDDLR